jgi:hypothetical protein
MRRLNEGPRNAFEHPALEAEAHEEKCDDDDGDDEQLTPEEEQARSTFATLLHTAWTDMYTKLLAAPGMH